MATVPVINTTTGQTCHNGLHKQEKSDPVTMETNERVTFSELIRPDLASYKGASNLAFNLSIRNRMKAGETIYHLGFGQAPFPIMAGMVSALREYAGENAYLDVAGIVELREAICKFHERYDNLGGLQADQVIVGPGTKELLFLLDTVFNGDILLLSPSWTSYKPQTQLTRHNTYIVETTLEQEWRLTAEALEQTILKNNMSRNKLLVFCNPDNPTGTSYKTSQLKAISEVCRRHNVIVLCDEIYSRLKYSQDHDTLVRYYPEGCVLSSGMSKWASAGGWRIGYHIYPPELKALRTAVASAGSHSFSCAPAPMQYAVAKALQNEEECKSYILHTSRILHSVATHCYRVLTSVGVKAIPSTAGYYIFPNFEILRESLKKRGILTGEQMVHAILKETSVALMSGGPSYLRPLDELTVRLCYVDFDGKTGLEESMRIGLDQPLPEDFVQQYCKPVYDGMEALKNWVLKQQRMT